MTRSLMLFLGNTKKEMQKCSCEQFSFSSYCNARILRPLFMWRTVLPISAGKEMKEKSMNRRTWITEGDSLENEPDIDFRCNLVHCCNKSSES